MLKQFFTLLGRYVRPYRKYLTWAVILNFVSQWLNVFSFMALVPILNILFKVNGQVYQYQPVDWSSVGAAKDALVNNAYWWMGNLIAERGALQVLLLLGGILILMTLLKTAGYFASSAVMVPLRTGVVRDIRLEVYGKVLRLPLSFFSEERKGDIIARMSADVTAVETYVTSSVDMLLRNPITILTYFFVMFLISWQMTLFVIIVLPLAGWGMGSITRKLKRRSASVQAQWGNIMTQLDETLGGLRIIGSDATFLRRFFMTFLDQFCFKTLRCLGIECQRPVRRRFYIAIADDLDGIGTGNHQKTSFFCS